MATRSATSARNEILDLLKSDHRKVKQVFRKFEGMDIEEGLDAVQQMVLQACDDLEVHATLEEELFYPAVREAIKDTMVVAEAEVEHAGAKRLIAELREMDPSEEAFAAAFTVLGEYVKHHIREEENEMFGQLERVRIDWEALRDGMLERRTALMAGMGMGAAQPAEEGAEAAEGEPADSEEAESAEPEEAVQGRGQGAGRARSAAKRPGSRSARSR